MFEARENASYQVAIAFCFEADWLKDQATFLDQTHNEIKKNLGNPV